LKRKGRFKEILDNYGLVSSKSGWWVNIWLDYILRRVTLFWAESALTPWAQGKSFVWICFSC
jgi:hypothetical protein